MDPAWINGLIGGLLIGLASAVYLLANGRIAGMTGILVNVMTWKQGDAAPLSAAFLLAAFGAAAGFAWVVGAPAMAITTELWALILSGLVVGVGVTFGNGCTSGHGVCGMSRFSVRSIVATITFMAGTAASVTIVRHVLELTL